MKRKNEKTLSNAIIVRSVQFLCVGEFEITLKRIPSSFSLILSFLFSSFPNFFLFLCNCNLRRIMSSSIIEKY